MKLFTAQEIADEFDMSLEDFLAIRSSRWKKGSQKMHSSKEKGWLGHKNPNGKSGPKHRLFDKSIFPRMKGVLRYMKGYDPKDIALSGKCSNLEKSFKWWYIDDDPQRFKEYQYAMSKLRIWDWLEEGKSEKYVRDKFDEYNKEYQSQRGYSYGFHEAPNKKIANKEVSNSFQNIFDKYLE